MTSQRQTKYGICSNSRGSILEINIFLFKLTKFLIFSSLADLPAIQSVKPGFHMIVGDRSRSLGSLIKCSAIVTIIWKPKFHFASDRQRSQRLPTIATITIAGIKSESISAIVAIVNDGQRSQKVNGNH